MVVVNLRAVAVESAALFAGSARSVASLARRCSRMSSGINNHKVSGELIRKFQRTGSLFCL